METGNKFIQICKDKGFDDKDIAKRYLSNQFNNIKTITGDVKEAVQDIPVHYTERQGGNVQYTRKSGREFSNGTV